MARLPADSLYSEIDEGLLALGLELTGEAVERLALYLRELARWNRAVNLTAVREAHAMVGVHLLDSLSVHGHLRGGHVLDVGTGAGLPGIPLSIANPDKRFVLLDSRGKRARFVRHIKAKLNLENVTVVQSRAESYDPGSGFDTVVARAFSSLAGFIEAAGHLCAPGGRLLAMKGAYPDEELAVLPRGWRARDVVKLIVPGLAAERHLVVMESEITQDHG